MHRVTLRWRDFSTDFESACSDFDSKSCVYALLSRDGPPPLYIGKAAEGLRQRYDQRIITALMHECALLSTALNSVISSQVRMLDELHSSMASAGIREAKREAELFAASKELFAGVLQTSTRFVVAEVEKELCADIEETLIDRELPRFNRRGIRTSTERDFESRIGGLMKDKVELVHEGDVPFRSHQEGTRSKFFQLRSLRVPR